MTVRHCATAPADSLPPRSLEEDLFWLRTVPRMPDASDWERDFAKSILRQAKRPAWEPSPAQRRTMKRLIDQHVITDEGDDDFDLIDDEDPSDAPATRRADARAALI
ncbi:hypothetical protein ACQ5SO_07475 [Rhodovulum sp. DZ06]|uniref:hypothetical protein n=1 Tax=Rhodovulum sp. DZ06 TaxID=3425126 RepID=UPI003D3466CD